MFNIPHFTKCYDIKTHFSSYPFLFPYMCSILFNIYIHTYIHIYMQNVLMVLSLLKRRFLWNQEGITTNIIQVSLNSDRMH